jgi:hypothetical protein
MVRMVKLAAYGMQHCLVGNMGTPPITCASQTSLHVPPKHHLRKDYHVCTQPIIRVLDIICTQYLCAGKNSGTILLQLCAYIYVAIARKASLCENLILLQLRAYIDGATVRKAFAIP